MAKVSLPKEVADAIASTAAAFVRELRRGEASYDLLRSSPTYLKEVGGIVSEKLKKDGSLDTWVALTEARQKEVARIKSGLKKAGKKAGKKP